jgi:hypothetical protein
MLSQLAYLAYLGAKKAKKDSSAAFYAQQARTAQAQRHKAARVNAVAQRKVARAAAVATRKAAIVQRQDARAAQVVRHKDARAAAVVQRGVDKSQRVADASAKWHEAQDKKRDAAINKQTQKNEANAEHVRSMENLAAARAEYARQAAEAAAQGGGSTTGGPGNALETATVGVETFGGNSGGGQKPIELFDIYGDVNAAPRGNKFETDAPPDSLDPAFFDDGGVAGLAGLGAKRARCRNPAPFYGTIAKYRKACKKAGNTYDRQRCICVDQYGRVWPYQQQQPVGPQFDPQAYLRQQEYYRQIQAQQLANQQYALQQQQQQYLYQQPQYQPSFPQGYASNYGSPFPSAFAPGSGGASGPAFSEEAELAASSGGGDDFGLPSDTVLFQGKGPSSPAAPTGAADSVTMPVSDIVGGELVVADDMAFEGTPSPTAAPEQMIAPNPITITPAFSQPASEGGYMVDDSDGMAWLPASSNLLGLVAVGAAIWFLTRKK